MLIVRISWSCSWIIGVVVNLCFDLVDFHCWMGFKIMDMLREGSNGTKII